MSDSSVGLTLTALSGFALLVVVIAFAVVWTLC